MLNFNIPNPYIHYSFASHPVLVGLVTAIVQSLYACESMHLSLLRRAWEADISFSTDRVWVVGRKRLVLPIIIFGLALIQLGFATGATVIAFTRPVADFLSDYTYVFAPPTLPRCLSFPSPFSANFTADSIHSRRHSFGITIWLASACVADFLITTSIVYHLRKAKKESGFVETQSILSTIIKTTIECNLLTAVVAMVRPCAWAARDSPDLADPSFVQLDAIVFARVPNNWHVALNVVLTKLYTLSLLASRASARLTPLSTLQNWGRSSPSSADRSSSAQ